LAEFLCVVIVVSWHGGVGRYDELCLDFSDMFLLFRVIACLNLKIG